MISVIIPVRNEVANIAPLLENLHNVMTQAFLKYEVITVDDYSTDGSLKIMQDLTKQYPLRAYKKQGIIGKGSSISEGIAHAKGSIIVLLEADLVGLTKEIPKLVDKLSTCDVAVVNRTHSEGKHLWLKRAQTRAEHFISNSLFKINIDTQSGLKAFHTYCLQDMNLEPTKWSFELTFLYSASHAGYEICEIDVPYHGREAGEDKMPFFASMFEMLLFSLKRYVRPLRPVSIGYDDTGTQTGWKRKQYQGYTNLSHSQTALETLTPTQILIFLGSLSVIVMFILFNVHLMLVLFISLITAIYFIDLLFNLFLIMNSMKKNPAIQISDKQIKAIKKWPRYTIMCPLYKEWEVVDQFVKAISALDYPKDKLQVILSLEEVDKKTIKEIGKMDLPPYFEVLVTPDTQPRTKPKACNYALMHTTGEYVVIYDAEDIPDPLQLKKAVAAFQMLKGQNVVCLQAKLNFYNPKQNLLTRLFTLEYSLWFDLVLTGLHSIGAPIPLGGTSNHFKKESLDLLRGWDPFNVTEDCDLGIRLFKNGYKTNVLESTTMEEANSSFLGWFKQRSRWIKGYIQTYLVHMRNPHEFITDWSNPHILTFQIIVGFRFMSMWINPILWIMTILYFASRQAFGPAIESLFITPILYIGTFSLVVGNFLYFYYNMIGAAKRGEWYLVKYAFFAPVYWLMMSYASLKALQSIILAPHYWEKTTHGLHKPKIQTS